MEEFARLFSLPIGVVATSVKLIVAYSAVVGILVAANGYLETKRVASAQVHLASLTAFEAFVKGRLDRLSYLNTGNVSVYAWHAFLYPDSRDGNLDVDESYLGSLRDLSHFVDRTNGLIFKLGRGYRHDQYHGPIKKRLAKFGIDIGGASRLEFFSLEREAFDLINAVNEVFCSGIKFARLAPSKAHRIP